MFLLFALFFVLPLFCEEREFGLKEIIEFSLKNNPYILINEKNIEIEDLNIENSKAERYPILNLFGSSNRYKYPYPVTPITFQEGKLIIPPFDKSIYTFGFSSYFPIYKGGRIDEGISISYLKKEIKELEYKSQREELIYSIAIHYYKILQLEKLKNAALFSVKQMELHKDISYKFYNEGIIPKIDLIKAEVELSRTKENLLSVSNSLKICYEILKEFMGIDDFNLNIKLKENYLKSFDLNIEKATEEGQKNRLEIKEIKKEMDLVEKKILFLKGKMRPDIFISQDLYLSTGNDFDFNNNWAISLKLQLPLFEGGKTDFEIKKEEIELEKLKEEERAVKNQIEREVREAFLNLENSRVKIDVLKGAVEEAKENLRIEQLLYEEGSNTSKDVIDAENFLLKTETSYLNALYEKEISTLDLFKAMGYDLIEVLDKEF